MITITRFFWKFLSKIPGALIINFTKGVLPSFWAFYFLHVSAYENLIDRYVNLYEESNVLMFILYYFLTFIFFYYIIDFGFRYFLLRKIGRKIYSYFLSIQHSKNIQGLRELGELRQSFLKGMDVTIEMGYLSRKELLDVEEIGEVTVDDKEEVIHEVGNKICAWMSVIFHLLLTLIFVFNFSWLLWGGLLVLTILIAVFVIVAISIMVSLIDSLPLIKKEFKRKQY